MRISTLKKLRQLLFVQSSLAVFWKSNESLIRLWLSDPRRFLCRNSRPCWGWMRRRRRKSTVWPCWPLNGRHIHHPFAFSHLCFCCSDRIDSNNSIRFAWTGDKIKNKTRPFLDIIRHHVFGRSLIGNLLRIIIKLYTATQFLWSRISSVQSSSYFHRVR